MVFPPVGSTVLGSILPAGAFWGAGCGDSTAGAAVDSLLFPTIAFDGLMPEIVALQFVAKTVGGAIWAWTLAYVQKTDLRPQ